MSTLNGIGTKFYGFSEANEQGKSFATYWFTFLYLPVIPLGKKEIQREITDSNIFRYRILNQYSLNRNEILKTYMWGWLIGPFILLWPLLLLIPEIDTLFQSLLSAMFDNVESKVVDVVLICINIVVVAWVWKDWEEERGLPKNYKEILKERRKKN